MKQRRRTSLKVPAAKKHRPTKTEWVNYLQYLPRPVLARLHAITEWDSALGPYFMLQALASLDPEDKLSHRTLFQNQTFYVAFHVMDFCTAHSVKASKDIKTYIRERTGLPTGHKDIPKEFVSLPCGYNGIRRDFYTLSEFRIIHDARRNARCPASAISWFPEPLKETLLNTIRQDYIRDTTPLDSDRTFPGHLEFVPPLYEAWWDLDERQRVIQSIRMRLSKYKGSIPSRGGSACRFCGTRSEFMSLAGLELKNILHQLGYSNAMAYCHEVCATARLIASGHYAALEDAVKIDDQLVYEIHAVSGALLSVNSTARRLIDLRVLGQVRQRHVILLEQFKKRIRPIVRTAMAEILKPYQTERFAAIPPSDYRHIPGEQDTIRLLSWFTDGGPRAIPLVPEIHHLTVGELCGMLTDCHRLKMLEDVYTTNLLKSSTTHVVFAKCVRDLKTDPVVLCDRIINRVIPYIKTLKQEPPILHPLRPEFFASEFAKCLDDGQAVKF
jgi:hypothetical protein